MTRYRLHARPQCLYRVARRPYGSTGSHGGCPCDFQGRSRFGPIRTASTFCCKGPAIPLHRASILRRIAKHCLHKTIIFQHRGSHMAAQGLHNMDGLHRASMLLCRPVLQYGCIGPAITLHKACHCEAYCVTGLVSTKTKMQGHSAARMQAQCS